MSPGRLAPLLLLLAACAGPAGLAGAPRAPSASTRRALEGWLAGGDQAAARAQLESLAVARPDDPWTRLGAALMAERALQPERAVGHLAAVVEAAPDHPLALVALRGLARLAFDVPELAPAVEALAGGAASARAAPGAGRLPGPGGADRSGRPARRRGAGGGAPRRERHRHRLDRGRPLRRLRRPRLRAPRRRPSRGGCRRRCDGPLLAPARPTRPLEVPAGNLTLEGEPFDGAYHVLVADLEVLEGGPHLAMVRAEGPYRAWLDGAPLAERRSWTGAEPAQRFVAVTLAPGPHQLLVKLGREGAAPAFLLGLSRADGRPARLSVPAAPARGRSSPPAPGRSRRRRGIRASWSAPSRTAGTRWRSSSPPPTP